MYGMRSFMYGVRTSEGAGCGAFLIWDGVPSLCGMRCLPYMGWSAFLIWDAVPSSHGMECLPYVGYGATFRRRASFMLVEIWRLAGLCLVGGFGTVTFMRLHHPFIWQAEMDAVNEKLKQQIAAMRKSSCWVCLMLLMVCLLFVFTFVLMKIFPKRKPPIVPDVPE